MEKLGKILSRYLLMSVMALMLVCFSVTTAFATEGTVEETPGDSGQTMQEQMLELAKTVEIRLDQSSFVYTGNEVRPQVTYYYAEDGAEKDASEVFEISDPVYTNNVNVGTEQVTPQVTAQITGYYEKDAEGNDIVRKFDDTDSTVSVTLSAGFQIQPMDISKTAEISVSDVTYSGSAQKPSVTVKLGDKTLVSRTDYKVTSWKNNVNAGTASVSISFIGNYTGTAAGKFTIKPLNISKTASVSSIKDATYNGKSQTPAVTVTAAGKTLKSDTDYTAVYSNNKNVGTATVKITFKGNYAGTVPRTFKIKAKSLSSDSIALAKTTYSYNGKTQQPGTTVKIKLASGTVTLTKNKDYTVSYSTDCKNIGKKTVTIKGKGNYSGTVKKTYKIVPEKASGFKVSSRGTSSLKVTCTKAKSSGCSYQFIIKKYDSKAKKWVQVSSKNTTSNSVTFTKLDAGRVYACYVRIYKKAGSDTYYGSWSSALKTPTAPSRPVMSYAVKTGSSSMKAVWKAVSSATGYEIQYSTKSDFSSNVKTVSVKGRTTTSKTISGLKSSGTYYVRVRAYYTYDKKTYRGAWSSKVSTYYSNVYASYTTYYNTGNTNRSTNLRLACNAINGKILANGDTFSFNAIVGERTAAKGYKEAIIYEGGQEVGGIGGGICQVATTLFNAALKANFTIVERHQHSLTVHYCPLGYDAAIAWGSKNLRFRNNSGTSVKVDIHASGGTLSVKFLTNTYKKPPAVSTKVTVRNGVYTLKRYVNGKVNYTTTSDYLDN